MSIDYFSAAATIAAALIQRKPANAEVSPEDVAKLVREVRQALIDKAPKGAAAVTNLRV